MKKIIIVDDCEPSGCIESSAYAMKRSFPEISNNTYFGDTIEDVKIAAALPQVKERVAELRAQGDEVVGLAIDLFQQRDDPRAGERLLDAIERDDDLRNIPVVVYTFTQGNDIAEQLLRKGAKAVVRRRLIGGESAERLARRVLEGLGFI